MSDTPPNGQPSPQPVSIHALFANIVNAALQQGIPHEALLGELDLLMDDIRINKRKTVRGAIVRASMPLPPPKFDGRG